MRQDRSVAPQERGNEKGKSPRTPPKEKEREKEFLPLPFPFGTCAPETDVQGAGKGQVLPVTDKGKGEAGFRLPVSGEGKAVRRKIDHDLIMDSRYDAVQIALTVLGIPRTVDCGDGRSYNNAKILRWMLRRLGEDTFREFVYMQWRENVIDGLPRNRAAAFMAKLNRAVYGPKDGGAA